MSSSEAQARLLAAFAARAFYEEQVRLVAAADIHGDEALLALQRVLSEIPPEQVRKMLENFATNPSLLSGDALTGLGLVLGVERAEAALLPLEERNPRIP
jgi:hypothetical protein